MTAEIVKTDRYTADITGVKALFEQFEEIKRSVLIQGKDYGQIPGIKGNILFKSGAEKLVKLFHLRIGDIEETNRTVDLQSGFVDFEYKVKINDPNGQTMSFGVGSCNSFEDKYAYTAWNESNQPEKEEREKLKALNLGRARNYGNKWVWQQRDKKDPSLLIGLKNTIQKMAKKRAYVDAVLNATGGSQFFTQDLDSMPALVDSEIDNNRALTVELDKWQEAYKNLEGEAKRFLNFGMNKIENRSDLSELMTACKVLSSNSGVVKRFRDISKTFPKNG